MERLNYVPENLHPTIKWSTQQSYPLEADMQDIQWQIVDRNEKLNSNLKSSISKTLNSFVTPKGSMPLKYKIVEHTSTKHKADNKGELHPIKKLKRFHNPSKHTAK
jgi:hypothetical protein